MKKNRLFPLTLIAVAVFAGCSSIPQSTTLDEARSNYSNAQANPQVTRLAPIELKEAGEALDRANSAQNKREDRNTVDSLAYLAKQKVAIAQATAQRKNAELALASAAAERNRVLLQGRTIEADQAHQQAQIAQQNADQTATALALANADAERAKQRAALSQTQAEQDKAKLAELQTQLDDLHAKKTAHGMVITLGDVLFDTNKAQLKSGGIRNVQKLADFLKQYPQRKVLIDGFTDSTGSNSYNQTLSEQRADSVRNALIDSGISPDRVATHGYGEAYPVASNNNAGGRQLNRRVEIVLSDENGNIAPR
ncbi:MAG: OmpA family protein [Pseudomonadota bacterium]